jgi:hypothetical protein
VGAIEAARLGLRNGNVSAVVGLDGTCGFKGSTEVLTSSYGYAPEKMRAAFLDLRRAQGEQEADLDLSSVLSFRYADRSLVTLRKIHQSDFTSFAMIASRSEVPIKPNYESTGWDRETGRRGYEDACRIVLGFLDDKLKGEIAATARCREAVQRSKGSDLRQFDAGLAPLSLRESLALGKQAGIDAVKSIITKCSAERQVGSCVDAGSFNTYGSELLGQHQAEDAVVIFQIVAWAHPTSANAQDSLADGLFAVGDEKNARTAIQRAFFFLVPSSNQASRQASAARSPGAGFCGRSSGRLP